MLPLQLRLTVSKSLVTALCLLSPKTTQLLVRLSKTRSHCWIHLHRNHPKIFRCYCHLALRFLCVLHRVLFKYKPHREMFRMRILCIFLLTTSTSEVLECSAHCFLFHNFPKATTASSFLVVLPLHGLSACPLTAPRSLSCAPLTPSSFMNSPVDGLDSLSKVSTFRGRRTRYPTRIFSSSWMSHNAQRSRPRQDF
jgi:hypothetical protein